MRNNGSNGTTITQVAKAAGVSRATVSRALNGRSTVDPGIRDRVQAAAEKLEYRPNMTARNLSMGRTLTIALIVPELGNPLFQSILQGLSRAAEADGYSVLVAEAPDPRKEAAIARDARNRCDAVVLAAPRMDDVTLRELVDRIAPVVLLNRPFDHPTVATVDIDYARGMGGLVEHLMGFGHRDLLYLSGPPGSTANRVRLDALQTCRDANPGLRLRTMSSGSAMHDGYGLAEEVLASGATAAIAFNDLVAFGLLARLNEVGVDVPGDLSVTGFDGIELSRYAVPSLTTVRQDEDEISRITWALLRARIEGGASGSTGEDPGTGDAGTNDAGTNDAEPEGSGSGDPETGNSMNDGHVVLTPSLVARDSTGRVPPSRVPVAPQQDPATPSAEEATAERPLGWVREGADWVLMYGGELLAAAVTGEAMSTVQSPRPHLHPVRSLRGKSMTVTNPLDHRHHFGVSLTVPDVSGANYWGGRTFVEGRGPTLLANHGSQKIEHAELATNGRDLRTDLRWITHEGETLLDEQRGIEAFPLPGLEGWGLVWRSRLDANTQDLHFTSPANKGRMGAGYGGLFWRLPSADEARIITADGSGESIAHGSSSPFIIVQRRHGEEWTSLVLHQDEQAQGRIDPWFVRASDYVGIGSSVAWSQPRVVERGDALRVHMTAAVLDRQATVEDVDALLAARAEAGE